ncbi:hypothetical protein GCM10023264_00330 [Sphingomonas daechungensis]|uniref:Phytanoyl-CoA dioxygenase family protein n=1 Tax=Sphingomonas daechungensis TaxID=1176646 RepID=A0ABX6T0I4_9SPHN|nr:DUF6445 family protein [Sphingomonas daechungensis]QNP42555.1 hypothetical protein H9L15_10035 [Sphingomonas daechungensis]
MVPALFVIDDFLRNAEEVRRQALSLTYAVGGRYPGLNSVEKLRIEGLDQVISTLVREPVRAPWTEDFSHGSCRVALASDPQEARIHIDQSHWSGILYLSRPEDCHGGTEFFRHKRTGTDRVPMDEAGLRQIGYASYTDLQHDILDQDALDRSKWEHTMTVPMRFNRLVLLQPHYWHTAGPGFGDSLENGRLIYLMFFLRGPA